MSERDSGHRLAQLRAKVIREESICWLCGHDVDKALKTPDPMSPEMHHLIPLNKGGAKYDRKNVRLTHRRCNRAQSDRMPARSFETLRSW